MDKSTLKSYFQDGDKPTEANFAAFIDSLCDDTAYDSSWNGITDTAPSKNAVYDKIETLLSNGLASAKIYVGNGSNLAAAVTLSGDATLDNTGALALLNSAVIGKVLTGYSSGAGTVSSSDTILQAIQKLNGNTNALGSTYVKLINGNVDFIYYSSDSFSLTNDLGAFAKSWLFYDSTHTKIGFNSTYMEFTTSGLSIIGSVAFGNFTATTGVRAELRTNANADIGFVIRGLGSAGVYTQTGDLTRWLSYNGTSSVILAKVDKDGNITAANFFLNGAGPLIPYKFFHEAPTNKSYTIDAKTVDSRTLLQIRGLKTASGTCTIAIKINGTAVTWTGSVTTLNVTSSAQDVVITSGGTYATGDRITVTITSASSPVDLEFALK